MISKKTKLFYPDRLADGGNDAIEFNLRARVPIYIGGNMSPYEVREPNYKNLLKSEYAIHDYAGMEKTQLLDHMKNSLDRQYEKSNPNPVRYSVCGPVMRFGENTGSMQYGNLMYVNHVWGINLESRGTADYARFVNQDTGKLSDYDGYAQTFREIIKLIFEGAAHAAETEQKVASVRIPKVSLGAFMSTLGPDNDLYGRPIPGSEKDPAGLRFAHEVFYKSVFEFAMEYAARGVTVVLCLRGLDEMDYELLSALNVLVEFNQRPLAPLGSNVVIENNLFNLSNEDMAAPSVHRAVNGLEGVFEHFG